MNREIKFRAWDKRTKQMIQVSCMEMSNKVDSIYGIEFTKNGGNLYKETGGEDVANYLEIMQYTGLKDKNSVEIYEGDIMHDPDGDYIWSIVWAKYTNKADLDLDLFIVGWIRKCIDGTLSPLGYYRGVEGNVIGNIYENPELLKQ